MLQEAANELLRRQRAYSLLAGVRVPVAKRHPIIFQKHNTIVADRHTEACPEPVEGM